MYLFLAGNFVIMGNKEREKAFQQALGKECCRLGSFFYRKEIEIVTQLKGEELNGNDQKETGKEIFKNFTKISAKRITQRTPQKIKPTRIISKKRNSGNITNDQTGDCK